LNGARARRALMLAALGSSPALAGCLGPGDYHCDDHAQCGERAFCEIDGRCSQVDTRCPSGRRYRHREGDVSDRCVGEACPQNPLRDVAAGVDHACALRADGTVSCWGRNDDGQLGDGTRTPRSLNVAVAGVPVAVAIGAGMRHTCAVTAAGEVFCWGADEAGQLGDGGGVSSDVPIAVAGITTAVRVAAGGAFSCAVLRDGTALCWGDNSLGQLGDGGAATAGRQPTPVFALAGIHLLAANGQHACAVRDDETLWCWGDNSVGQLGDGSTTAAPRPVRVQALTAVTGVATGLLHTCAATRADGLFCWGNNNAGQLGHEAVGSQPRPMPVPIVTDPVAVAAGANHTCAIRQGGQTLCWGANADGQLGAGSLSALPIPVPVSALGASASIVAGGSFSCARGGNGDLFCWGDDHYGQLGLGSATFRARATPVSGVTGAIDVAAGATHSCVVRAEKVEGVSKNHAACWGANQAGQLGDNTTIDRTTPTPVSGEIDAVRVAAGLAHSCIAAADGAVWCWGRGKDDQLGPARTLDTVIPTLVPLVMGARAEGIAAGDAYTCALLADGTASCWGTNDEGQLGDGMMVKRPEPAPVDAPDGTPPLGSINALVTGAGHACALLAKGDLLCWGRGANGQLGEGMTVPRALPVAVTLVASMATPTPVPAVAVAVAAGAAHTCALDDGGRVWCWGRGWEGQLGSGAKANDALSPVMLPAPANARGIAAGGAHSCAVTEDRTVVCWGANDDGQLGDGSTEPRPGPVDVVGLTDVERLSAGAAHTCATRQADQSVWCWGGNFAGQLGDGVILSRTTPQLARLACD
jgi:alpha-tubulin suppressor-like RCC1 family protein